MNLPDLTEDERKIVLTIQNGEWDWRSVSGLADATELAESHIREILEGHPDLFIRRHGDSGAVYYTTRSHYKTSYGPFDQAVDALSATST